jgi:Arc/MetJ-type ribon-helix-helix transcriptional regulator
LGQPSGIRTIIDTIVLIIYNIVMNRVTISIPDKLKEQTSQLIERGFYASFSDAVRSALRNIIEKNKYDLWADEAKKEFEEGRAYVLNDKEDIDEYMEKK